MNQNKKHLRRRIKINLLRCKYQKLQDLKLQNLQNPQILLQSQTKFNKFIYNIPNKNLSFLRLEEILLIQAQVVCTDRLLGCSEPKSRGKQPRLYTKVPKQSLSGKGSDRAMTTRRWAWKQPSFEESIIAHWSSSMASKMYQGSSDSLK